MTASVILTGIGALGMVFLIRFLIALYQEDKAGPRQIVRVQPRIGSHIEVLEIEDKPSIGVSHVTSRRNNAYDQHRIEDDEQQLAAEYPLWQR